MSGVYIKGIEVPTVCEECPCFVFIDTGTMPSCGVLHEDMGIEQAESYRLKNCPLVPVPDHGRLIDADKLMNVLGISPNCKSEEDCEGQFCAVCFGLREAPTVIEADRSE